MQRTSPPFATPRKTPSGSVPEQPPPEGAPLEAAGIALGLAFLTALAAAGSILSLGEAASDRTQSLVAVIGCGAFAAALCTGLLTLWITARWNRWLRATLASAFCGGAFVPATLFCFAVQNRLIGGHLNAETLEELRPLRVVWSMLGAMGMFTPTGLRYLTPWPLLVLAIGAAAAFFVWPRRMAL
jgi:hypothetical protein